MYHINKVKNKSHMIISVADQDFLLTAPVAALASSCAPLPLPPAFWECVVRPRVNHLPWAAQLASSSFPLEGEAENPVSESWPFTEPVGEERPAPGPVKELQDIA